MDNLQLVNSIVGKVSGEPVTLFIASEAGRLGLVQAGTWETVLPFRFDRIIPLSAGTVAAFTGGRHTVYQLDSGSSGLTAVALDGDGCPAGAITLPA